MDAGYPPKTDPLTAQPFARPGLSHRLWPFAAVALLTEASLVLPPGPTSTTEAVLSLIFLLAVAAVIFLLSRSRASSAMTVLVPVLYVVSVLFLNLATGGSKSGTGIVILIPLIWTALYHRRWESFVVVAAIVGAQIATAITPVQLSDTAILRRVVLWSALGLLISLATHELRERLLRTLAESEASRRRTESLQQAAEQLTTLLDPNEILATATRLAALLVSPPGTPGRRSQYLRVVEGMVNVEALYDDLQD